MLGLAAAGLDKASRRKRAEAMLVRVGLDGFGDARPRGVSGGMRQRVALARVLALMPRVLLLDEPFAALDAITREQMQDLLVVLHRDAPVGMLLVTHDVAEAVRLADTGIVMGAAGRGVVGRFTIPLPRPRDQADPVCLDVGRAVRALLRGGETGPDAGQPLV